MVSALLVLCVRGFGRTRNSRSAKSGDQNRLTVPHVFVDDANRSLRRASAGLFDAVARALRRQKDAHAGAGALAAVDLDRARVPPDDPEHRGHAEAATLEFRREEGIEDSALGAF